MSNTMPLVSIIIPVYNVEAYLEECIDSIDNQTYKNMEIIFVNDGSTDRSSAILDGYHQKNPNSIIINQKNSGVSAARNAGMERSSGEYLTFIDADDVVASDYIECLVGMMDTSIDITMCGFKQIQHAHELVAALDKSDTIKDGDSYDVLTEIFYGFTLDSGPFCKLYRREAIGDVRYDTSRIIGEDLDFLCRILSENRYRVRYSTRPLYGYRTRPRSAMTDAYSHKYYDYFLLAHEWYEKLQHNSGLKRAAEYRLFGIASFGIGKMRDAHDSFKQDYIEYNRALRRFSMTTLLTPRSGIKNKMFAIGYRISPAFTSWIRRKHTS